MSEADSLRAVEHDDVDQVLEVTVIKRLGEPHGGMVLEQGVSAPFEKLELQLIVEARNRALVVVFLRAQLHPLVISLVPASAEVHALVDRAINVACPKATEPSTRVSVLNR